MFKKIILAALVVTSAVFAQVHVGGRAAANYGFQWGADAIDELDGGLGFNAGAAVKIDILPMLSIVTGLEADLRRVAGKEEYDDYDYYMGQEIRVNYSNEVSMNMWYLDVPVLARLNVIPMFHADLGVLLGLKLAANMHQEKTASAMGRSETRSKDTDFSKDCSLLDAGLVAGVGVSPIPGMLDVDFRFVLGLTTLDKDGDASVKHMRMQLGATFWFM